MVVLYPNKNEIKARRHSKCNPGIRRKRRIEDFIESRQEDYQGPSIKRLELGSRETLHIEKQKETSLINKGGVHIIKVVHGRSGSSISKQKSLNYENDIGDSDVDDSENNDDEFTPYLSGRFIASKQRRHTDSTKNNSIENEGKYKNRAYILSGYKDAYKSRSSSTSNDTKPKTRQKDSGETSSANSDYISSSPNKTKEKEILDLCPLCQGNCNCNFCLQSNIKMPNIDFDDDVKLQHLQYQISLFLPFRKQIRKEQIEEIVVKTHAKAITAQHQSLFFIEVSQNVHMSSVLPVVRK
nr:concanavalin A-like lectin/glucanase, subgroup [Tanacetum cinerariifolium]